MLSILLILENLGSGFTWYKEEVVRAIIYFPFRKKTTKKT